MRLDCIDIEKRYYSVKALDEFNVSLEAGKVYALLGPNGSGKSTIMKMIAGLTHPDEGEILLDRVPLDWRSKAGIAYMPTENFYQSYMRVSDVRNFYRDFFEDFDPEKFDWLIRKMEIPSDRRMRELSSGMMGKLKIAAIMSRNAGVILLDEPTNGIDLLSREQILRTILENIREDVIMVISSHMVEELEKIVDNVIFMQDGKVIMQGNVEDLRNEKGKSVTEIYREIYG